MLSYYQDRVANEAFIETAGQRFSLRQHAVLLGIEARRRPRADDACSRSTSASGLRARRAAGPDADLARRGARELHRRRAHPRAAPRTRAAGCTVAAFPGAIDAELPAGATELLLWGHGAQLAAGDRLAFVQGSFSQVVTLDRRAAAGSRRRAGSQDAERRRSTRGPTRRPRSRGCDWAEPLAAGAAAVVGARAARAARQPRRRRLRDAASRGRRTGDGARAGARSRSGSRRRTSIVTAQQRRGAPAARAARAGVAGRPRRRRRRPQPPAVRARRLAARRGRQVEHLHSSRSYDLHYTAEADEEGAVWLRFGDGVHGREVALDDDGAPAVDDRAALPHRRPGRRQRRARHARRDRPPGRRHRRGRRARRPRGGRASPTSCRPPAAAEPHTLAAHRARSCPSSLRHGPLQRAVALEDYAAVAMAGPGRRPGDRPRRRRPVQHGDRARRSRGRRATSTRACAGGSTTTSTRLRMTGPRARRARRRVRAARGRARAVRRARLRAPPRARPGARRAAAGLERAPGLVPPRPAELRRRRPARRPARVRAGHRRACAR